MQHDIQLRPVRITVASSGYETIIGFDIWIQSHGMEELREVIVIHLGVPDLAEFLSGVFICPVRESPRFVVSGGVIL